MKSVETRGCLLSSSQPLLSFRPFTHCSVSSTGGRGAQIFSICQKSGGGKAERQQLFNLQERDLVSSHSWTGDTSGVSYLGKKKKQNFFSVLKDPESGGKAQNLSVLKSRVKFPQSVMVWGVMSSAAVGPPCFLKSRVNAAGNLRALYASSSFIEKLISFQQDVAPAHSTKTTTGWFTDHNWPAHLTWSPKKNLWDICERTKHLIKQKKNIYIYWSAEGRYQSYLSYNNTWGERQAGHLHDMLHWGRNSWYRSWEFK